MARGKCSKKNRNTKTNTSQQKQDTKIIESGISILRSICKNNDRYKSLLTNTVGANPIRTNLTLSDEELGKIANSIIKILSTREFSGSVEEQSDFLVFVLDDEISASDELTNIVKPIVDELRTAFGTEHSDLNELSTRVVLKQCMDKMDTILDTKTKVRASDSISPDKSTADDTDNALTKVVSYLHKGYSTDMIGRASSMFQGDIRHYASDLLQAAIADRLVSRYDDNTMMEWGEADIDKVMKAMYNDVFTRFVTMIMEEMLSSHTPTVREQLSKLLGDIVDKLSDDQCDKLIELCSNVDDSNFDASQVVADLRTILNDDTLCVDCWMALTKTFTPEKTNVTDSGTLLVDDGTSRKTKDIPVQGNYQKILHEVPGISKVMSQQEVITLIDYMVADCGMVSSDTTLVRLEQVVGTDRIKNVLDVCDISTISEAFRV